MDAYKDDANTIYSDFRTKLRMDEQFRALDSVQQLSHIQKKYPQFAKTFPIVLRYMVQMQKFSSRAFERFIKKMKTKPYRSEEEFCERQADYVKYLFIETSHSHNTEDAKKVWTRTYETLLKEVKAFKQAEEQIKKKLDKTKQINSKERRHELKQLLKSLDNC